MCPTSTTGQKISTLGADLTFVGALVLCGSLGAEFIAPGSPLIGPAVVWLCIALAFTVARFRHNELVSTVKAPANRHTRTVIVAGLVATPIAWWASMTYITAMLDNPLKHASVSVTGLIVSLALSAVIVPFYEETLFRGVVLSFTRRTFGAIGSIVVTALLFSLFHLNGAQIAQTLPLTVIATTVAYATGTIRWSVLVHGMWNALTLVTSAYGELWQMKPPHTAIVIISVVAAAVIMAMMMWLTTRNNTLVKDKTS